MGRGRIIPSRKKREKTTRYDKKGRCWKPTYVITESPLRNVWRPGYLENPKLLVKYVMTEKIH